jgi:site-specific DNA-cytosine methylase
MVENVPEFASWGPIGSNGRPIPSRKGEVFRAWVAAIEALGYRVDWRELCAADYGDPTTRRRLFVQAVRGRRRIMWPDATHSKDGDYDMIRTTHRWRGAREVIDWTVPDQSIYDRKRPLSPKTMARIEAGLRRFGVQPFLVEYYGNGGAQSLKDPLNTVTTKDRHALVRPVVVANGKRYTLDIRFRMLQPHELAAAQGFRRDYQFTGIRTEKVKQIGNAVPRSLARALVTAQLSQQSDVSKFMGYEPKQ